MNSLLYLMRTGLKNWFKELTRKPARLVMYLLLTVWIVGMILLTMLVPQPAGREQLPVAWLRGIYFLFVTMFFGIAVQKGLTSGGAIFDMSDVNLLFVSPVNSRLILMYGLVRLAKVSFWAGFFILFQKSSLSIFGVDAAGIVILFLNFMLLIMAQSILSLVIYSFSNSNPRRKMLVRVLAVLCYVPFLLIALATVLPAGDRLAALEQLCSSGWLKAVPLAGWSAAAVVALLEGQLAAGVAWIGLLLLAVAGMLFYITFSRVDYYEDVLVATETEFEKKKAAESGDVQAAMGGTSGKVKVTRTGVAGVGARAIFYKHLRETFRQNRFGFFSLSTLIVALCVNIVAVTARDGMDMVSLLQILMWIQIFFINNGRGLRELYIHHIYLIPEPAFRKVVWSNMEIALETLLESVVLIILPGILMRSHAGIILCSVLVYTLFSLLLLGINYLSMRWTQTNLTGGPMLLLYVVAVLLMMLPGLVGAIFVGIWATGIIGENWGIAAGLLTLAAWELAVALGCFALSRNVLHCTDMQNMPGKK